MSAAAEVRALRRQVRSWRRGRADTRLVDAVSDAYIAIFATVMLGSMVVNVVVNVRSVAGRLCTSPGCENARALLPWLFAGAVVTTALAGARLFGPMLVSPAVGAWLVATPLDRAALLRPRLVGTGAVALVSSALLTAGAAALAGFGLPAVAAFTASVALLCLLVVCFAVVDQERAGRGARPVTWTLAAVVWVGLVLLAADAVPQIATPRLSVAWAAGLVTLGLGTIALAALAALGLGLLGRGQLAVGGSLVPSLSGALATLDLSLVYDVLVARRWRTRASVSPRRGGPSGVAALLFTELVRLRRTPQPLVTLAASVVLPYLAATAGLGRVVVLVGTAASFLAGLGLLSGLRVVSRTSTLARCLPWPDWQVRAICLVTPGAAMTLAGLAVTPALVSALAVSRPVAALVAVATGIGGTAAATRWMTGRPPDYTRPLVSTPAGAVPTNLYGSLARGFDVLLLVTAPLLLAPDGTGAVFSLVFSAVVTGVLLGRR